MYQVIIYIVEFKRINIHSFKSFVKDELTTQSVVFTSSVLIFDRTKPMIYFNVNEHLYDQFGDESAKLLNR